MSSPKQSLNLFSSTILMVYVSCMEMGSNLIRSAQSVSPVKAKRYVKSMPKRDWLTFNHHASSTYLQISLCDSPESLGLPRTPGGAIPTVRRDLASALARGWLNMTSPLRPGSLSIQNHWGHWGLTSMALGRCATSIIQQSLDFQTWLDPKNLRHVRHLHSTHRRPKCSITFAELQSG